MHIIGFVISLVLTYIALKLTLAHKMAPGGLLFTILFLAVLQIFVQLLFFMHITEKVGHRWHVWMLSLGFLFTFAIVGGSMWIMTFGGTVVY